MNNKKRYLITVVGVVQGVGFRPFVFRQAKLFGIKGFVENQGTQVLIEAEGEKGDAEKFIKALKTEYPKNAEIVRLEVSQLPFFGYLNFFIRQSGLSENMASFIPADIAVCEKCIEEYNSKGSKRYKYPFISCTDCGPRYSIIKSLPYDRDKTEMKEFPMCSECVDEYESPRDRRFHAQTNCCEKCGPRLKLIDKTGEEVLSESIEKAVGKLLLKGKIIAVKGIGGFHLCCSAKDDAAVKRLRLLKRRPQKPLAVMARNLEAVKKLCLVSEEEKEVLLGDKKPILLLRKKSDEILSSEIAPKQKNLGVMLPYAPVHLMLFPKGIDYLVMTSGNISKMPICKSEEEALNLLSGIVDYFLTHNREITVPVDDSVIRVIDGREQLVRLGRGYAPLTIPIKTEEKIMALGAEQKAAIAFTSRGYAAVSQYLGDLKEYTSYKAYERQIEHFKGLFSYSPRVYVHDLNSDYLSTAYAKDIKEKSIGVQHHHAHMAGCMAENGLEKDVIGVIYDGSGLGKDGAVWGGEFFTGSKANFERVGHLKYVTLQGGDSVVESPLKCAVLFLLKIGIEPKSVFKNIDEGFVKILKNAVENNIKCFESSSMGRFFDCVSALCGFNEKITYDAQAAIELEAILDETVYDFYDYEIEEQNQIILGYEKIIKGIVKDVEKNIEGSVISAKFHNSVVIATAECVCKIRERTCLNDVVLSGGVFENEYILKKVVEKLKNLNFNVYFNRRTPLNDGGLSFGQAVYASYLLKEE